MSDSIFRFTVGDFACAIVDDGVYTDRDLDRIRQPLSFHSGRATKTC